VGIYLFFNPGNQITTAFRQIHPVMRLWKFNASGLPQFPASGVNQAGRQIRRQVLAFI